MKNCLLNKIMAFENNKKFEQIEENVNKNEEVECEIYE